MYNPDKSEEKSLLPEDTVFPGVVTNVTDGKVSDFVTNLEKWKDPSGLAVNVDVDVKHDGKAYKFSELFTYRNEGDVVVYGGRSRIGRFAKKYGGLPKSGVVVKAMTNVEGFLRLKLE